nr:hypothetical protein [Tanacetum cinerariifolium]
MKFLFENIQRSKVGRTQLVWGCDCVVGLCPKFIFICSSASLVGFWFAIGALAIGPLTIDFCQFIQILYRVDGDDFYENCSELWFILIDIPFGSAGRPAAESLGGGTGVRVGRGRRGRRPKEGVNGNVEGANRGAPDFLTIIAQQLQNLLSAMLDQQLQNLLSAMLDQVCHRGNVGNQNGCSYKEFLACNPKEYDGRLRGMCMALLHRSMGWWQQRSQRICKKAVQISSALTNEAVRNGSIKNVEKRGNMGEPSQDKNGRDDNKRTKTGNAFATIANPVRRENAGAWPKCATCNSYHAPGGPCRTCFNCNHPGHLAKDCKGVPRIVNLVNARNPPVKACYEYGSTDHVMAACPRLNRAQGPGGNRPNQVVANNEGQGRRNQENQAMGRVFMLGAEEACQDPNIMMGTFTLNDYFATTLFDSGADYSFVSTTFTPLLGKEPSEIGFRYKIEIASGQLVELDNAIKGCRLEIEGHVFDIDLIPFGHGSFDVIIGMDWLSNHKAKIICHEKVVRIPLLDGNVLRVLGEISKEKTRLLMSTKASDKKQEEIVMVRDFLEIMLPRMRTQSAGRPAAKSLGGETGIRVGRGGKGKRPREGCSYKEFLACKPKEYDGKGGDVVLTRWIKKIDNMQDMSGCSIDQKVKYTDGSFVGKALTWWNSQIYTLSWEFTVSMSWNDFKFMMIEEFCPSHEMQKMVAATEPKTMQKAMEISCALTDEAVRNGLIKKVKKRGNVGEPRKDKNGRDDNKRTRTGNAFATTANPVGRENAGSWRKCATCKF